MGIASNIGPQFYEIIGDSPIAVAFGIPPGLPFPGVSVEIPYTNAGYAEDKSPRSEGNVLGGTTVTVSPIQGTYQAESYSDESGCQVAMKHSGSTGAGSSVRKARAAQTDDRC